MSDWLRPLLLMFYAPARGMAEVRERAPLGPAFVMSLLAQFGVMLYVMWPLLSPTAFAPGGARSRTSAIPRAGA